jgi:hypothetical protein
MLTHLLMFVNIGHIWLDLPGTVFFVTFLTTLLISGGVKNEIKKGGLGPVSNESLSRGIYRMFPLRVRNPWARATWLSLEFLLIWATPTIFAFAMACSAGWMTRNGDSTCQVSALWYIWMKGLYAGFTAAMVYPLAMLSGANRSHLPNYWYQVIHWWILSFPHNHLSHLRLSTHWVFP